MKKVIFNIRLERIVAYIVFIAFFTPNCYAFTNVSPFGTRRIEDEPSGTSIEKFLQNGKEKRRSVSSRNRKVKAKLEAMGEEINYGYGMSRSIRVRNKQAIKREQREAERTKQNYIISVNEGKNENGTKYKRYSGKSLKLVKYPLKMLGLHSKHYSEVKKLFPENHAHEWSLLYNYQQSDDSKIKFNFTINDKQGFSETRYGIFRNKVFSEEDKKDENDKDKKSEINTALANDEKEEDSKDENKNKGEFHWVKQKRIKTNIQHKESSSTYAINNGPNATEAYDLVTGYDIKIDYLGEDDDRIIEKEVDKEYHNEKGKRVVTEEHSINYVYNTSTFKEEPDFTKEQNKEKAHMTETTRKYEVDEYVKSKKEEGVWLPEQYKEITRDNTWPNKIVEKYVKQKYDRNSNEIENKVMGVHEYSDSDASNKLDKYYGLVQSDYSYIPIDAEKDEYLSQYDKYKSIRIDGEFSSIDEVFEKTDKISMLAELNELKKGIIKSNNLFDNVTGVKVTNYDNIDYNEKGERITSTGDIMSLEKDKNDIVSHVTRDFENSILKRDEMRRIVDRKEIITNDSKAPAETKINEILDIEYNLKGLQESLVKFITEKGPGLDKCVKFKYEDMEYNDIGQLHNYHRTNFGLQY